VPASSRIPPARGQITPATTQSSSNWSSPTDMPAVVRIVWPSAPTITTAAKLNEVAAEAMKILGYASTRYAQIRAQRRC
jgi:hypothetical protein